MLRSSVSLCALFALGLSVACSATEGGTSNDGGTDSSGSGASASGGAQGSGASSSSGGIIIGSGSTSSSGGGNGICQNYEAESKPNPPAILILLDQSGSMKSIEGGKSRWEAARGSVIDAVTNLEGVAHFGLIGFPTHQISSDADASQTCNAELKVAPGPNAASSISSSINPAIPSMGHTPVRAALNLAKIELAKPVYADKARYVVLVTDGLPNCKGILPTSSATSGFANYEDPSDAVTALKNDGVTTFVVGYGIGAMVDQWSEGNPHNAVTYANNMAKAGGTDAHHAVSTGPELEAVLADITKQVAPCSFDLDASPRGGASYVRVTIDGKDYALDDADGWVLEGEKTIALRESGAACGVLRDGGDHSIQIQVECTPVLIK